MLCYVRQERDAVGRRQMITIEDVMVAADTELRQNGTTTNHSKRISETNGSTTDQTRTSKTRRQPEAQAD